MVNDSAGAIFIADLLASLPSMAHQAARAVLRRHAGVVMHLPHTIKREEQRAYIESLMLAGLSRPQIVYRIVACYAVTERHAYRLLKALSKD